MAHKKIDKSKEHANEYVALGEHLRVMPGPWPAMVEIEVSDNPPGLAATTIVATAMAFELLNRHGFRTHFLGHGGTLLGADSFLALPMVKRPRVRYLVRFNAQGSYGAVHPETTQGQEILPKLELYLFDKEGGPFEQRIIWDASQSKWALYWMSRDNWSEPITPQEYLAEDDVRFGRGGCCFEAAQYNGEVAVRAATLIREAWKADGKSLHDISLRFGMNGSGDWVLMGAFLPQLWTLYQGGENVGRDCGGLYGAAIVCSQKFSGYRGQGQSHPSSLIADSAGRCLQTL